MKNKIIAVIVCISVIASVICLSCYAVVEQVNSNETYILNNGIFQTGYSENYQLTTSGKLYIDEDEYTFTIINITGDTTNYIITSLSIRTNDGFKSIYNNSSHLYKIEFNNATTTVNNYFKNYIDGIEPTNYEKIGNFLGYITDTFTTIVNYCITNTIILVVISIVFVSLAVGVLIRINRKKF